MKAQSKSAAAIARPQKKPQPYGYRRHFHLRRATGDYFAPLRRDVLHEALSSFTLPVTEVKAEIKQEYENEARLEIFWKIEPLTANDLTLFLGAVGRSLTETACDVLEAEGVPKRSLKAYRAGKRLLDLRVRRLDVGSLKIRITIEYTPKAKSESWFKSVAKGVLKSVAIRWISALLIAGPQPGGSGGAGGAGHQQADPGVKSVPALVATLAQTGKQSTLVASVPGADRAFLSVAPPTKGG